MTAAPGVIDLNADLGESFGAWRLGDDEALLAIVTSANIACGFHAGDPLTIRRACAGAIARGVSIGAQVSYRDLAGFGRREMVVPPEELTAEVLYQIAALDGIARAEGGRVGYVKPHGALYNRCVRDPVQAAAVAEAVKAYDPGLPLLTLPGGATVEAAADAWAHRRSPRRSPTGPTAPTARSFPRGQPGAVISDPDRAAARAASMATGHSLESEDGQQIPVRFRSICVHGDTAGAVALARAVREALERAGVRVAPFA